MGAAPRLVDSGVRIQWHQSVLTHLLSSNFGIEATVVTFDGAAKRTPTPAIVYDPLVPRRDILTAHRVPTPPELPRSGELLQGLEAGFPHAGSGFRVGEGVSH